MDNDMLSLMMLNDHTKSLARKIFRLALALLIMSAIYSLLDLSEWYSFLKRPRTPGLRNSYYIYSRFFRPIVALVVLCLSLAGHLLSYKAYRYINNALEQEDQLMLNNGFRNIYLVYLLSFISLTISILSIFYRYFILGSSL